MSSSQGFRYDSAHLRRIAMPLGGIGTGTVSLGGRGDLRDWELMNHTAKGFSPENAFFALRAKKAGGEVVTRALEGPIDPADYQGTTGSPVPNAGLPRFARARFESVYPFGRVRLDDPEVPLRVMLEAFNPLVPADEEASGWPVAVLRFVLSNPGRRAVEASVCGSLQNFIGTDGTEGAPKANENVFRVTPGLAGLFFSSRGVDPEAEQAGTMALALIGRGLSVTHRTSWIPGGWQREALLDFWDDFSEDGRLDATRGGGGGDAPTGSLALRMRVPPRSSRVATFLLAWRFPNRRAWTWPRNPRKDRPVVGNFYATRWTDAWDVARAFAPRLPRLEQETRRFTETFLAADLPEVVKEAALHNLSTLRSQTCFRTADGRFFGWEGGHNLKAQGNTHGSCTHVWGYEQTLGHTFGALARTMREVNFAHMTDADGAMRFRVSLPLERSLDWRHAAADGQMAMLLALYREWRLSGDAGFLAAHWPAAKRAMEFCWLPGSWDADRDGVMEGCQHNTMDVEYYGPNVQMTGWYLGALRAVAEMARAQGDLVFSATCDALAEKGRAWIDAHLFNGEFYEQEIRPPTGFVEPRTRLEPLGDAANPRFQLGRACIVDQLVGALTARVCGLGDVLDPERMRRTLRSIKRHNFRRSLRGHFNQLRTFALGAEAATLMASYPCGGRPAIPFPYFNEVMPGFEYTAAIHLLYLGETDAGLEMLAAIRSRYDGWKRNPFDESEWGNHYARSMIAWAAMLALTGFHYSAVSGRLEFRATKGTASWFWSTGMAWGMVTQSPRGTGRAVTLRCLHGVMKISELRLTGFGARRLPKPRRIRAGESLRLLLSCVRQVPQKRPDASVIGA